MNDQEQKKVAEDIHEASLGLRDVVTKMIGKYLSVCSELKQCRNELCLQCGNYKEAHNGACKDCRYRKGGEWESDLNAED